LEQGQRHGFGPGDGFEWAGFLAGLNHQDVYGQLQGVMNLEFDDELKVRRGWL
jgi:hypothetical protein